MTTFKLLGVRPMPGCDKKFFKNLNTGEIYKFYRSCHFLNRDRLEVKPGEEVERIDFRRMIPDDFFDTKSTFR